MAFSVENKKLFQRRNTKHYIYMSYNKYFDNGVAAPLEVKMIIRTTRLVYSNLCLLFHSLTPFWSPDVPS